MFTRDNTPYKDLFEKQLDEMWPSLGIGNQKFLDFLEPVKYYLRHQANLQTFSIAKYLEVPDSLALWLELLAQTSYLYEHLYLLDESNLGILVNKYEHFPTAPKTKFYLGRTCSLQQIQWLQTWVWQTHLKVMTEIPVLKPVLHQGFWQKHLQSRVNYTTAFFEHKLILGDFLHEMGYGFGLFEIKLPVLVGFKLSLGVYQELDMAESTWELLESVLHQLSSIYTILDKKSSYVLTEFLYYNRLSDALRQDWWLKSEAERQKIIADDAETLQAVEKIVSQFDQNLRNDIDRLELPLEFKQFLEELATWVFGLGG